ncbi:MAG: hypothetical protein GF317_11605 [Candidatus Lokiarchaeota archaeon]|nr:hypothetical protein [Candidatus Lokiarchaeota archaeon]MBD3200296.1 hypothetical protein [Candidatus Lokiarchaeota archaeon]
MDIFNILIAGIGGQGTILLGNILREYGLRSPLIKNVVGTETRGVSQREGSVSSTVRYLIDSKIYSLEQGYEIEDLVSPLIPTNDAHLIIGLEPLETLRNLKFISEKTEIIYNTHKRFPRNVLLNSELEGEYPSNAYILDILDQFARRTISMDFTELSIQYFESSIYANIISLGVSVKEFQNILHKKLILKVIKDYFPDSTKNTEAFELGFDLV